MANFLRARSIRIANFFCFFFRFTEIKARDERVLRSTGVLAVELGTRTDLVEYSQGERATKAAAVALISNLIEPVMMMQCELLQ